MNDQLQICNTYQELKQQLDVLDEVSKKESAKKLADSIVASDIFSDSPNAWIVRQLLKYLDPEKRDAYISYILTNATSMTTQENIDIWLGKPLDNEGAIILMESAYNQAGWEWVISAQLPYSLNQRVRMLHRLQTSEAEDVFITLLNEQVIQHKNKSSTVPTVYNENTMKVWKEPDTWPHLIALPDEKKYMLWSMYAKYNNTELLLKLATKLGWNTWVSEQIFQPNTNYYAFKYKDRLAYIKNLITNVKTLNKNSNTKIEMPEFDFSMG